MANKRIKDFFNSKFFEIPKYQRGYAWEKSNVRDLFEDIQEAIEVKANHYIGTIVLSKTDRNDYFFVVDGQQRITTITMIIHALISHMDDEDAMYYRRFYIREGDDYRLAPLGREKNFFKELLKNGVADLNPVNGSQRLLIEAYQEIMDMFEHILKTTTPKVYLESIENLQIMEFVEESEGDAIRIFQTVNDRGKPLTNMEKTKSLLVYFSNRYLGGALDSSINDGFGKIFELYDQIKLTGQLNNIDLISGRYGEFTEDNIMRYHFVTFSTENYDPTAAYILQYLKSELKKLRKTKDNDLNLEIFINNYVESLLGFFNSLNEVIQKTKTDKRYFKIFSILGLSPTLYPLITVLNSQKRLDNELLTGNSVGYNFLDLIEIIDVRVYKVRGTDPKSDMAKFVYKYNNNINLTDEQISEELTWFNSRWMSESEFRNNLLGSVYKRSKAVLPFILLDYSEFLSSFEHELEDLKDLVKTKSLTVEHILSQTPKFSLDTHGFQSEEEYLEFEHTLGNLTLLEKNINGAVKNKNISEKVSFYDKSRFKVTKLLATEVTYSNQFDKKDIEARTEKIMDYMEVKWWC